MIKRSQAGQMPIIIQKGYPSAVLLDIGLFTDLRQRAEAHAALAQDARGGRRKTEE